MLKGKPIDSATLRTVADAAVSGAKPLKHNAFKVELTRRAIVRALMTAAA